MNSLAITRFVHSRWMVIISAMIMVGCGLFAATWQNLNYITSDRGIVFPSPDLWLGDVEWGTWLNLGALLVNGLLMTVMVKVYNLLRTMTTLASSLFFAMTVATPDLLVRFTNGTLLAMTIMACLFLLFTAYGDQARMKNIFLIFVILSALAMVQYSYVVYIPVFIIGCAQMRIFSMRSVVATLLGIITPWFLVLGSGIVAYDTVHAPDIVNIFTNFGLNDVLHIAFATIITIVVLVGAWFLNLMKMLSYNAHRRAFSGALSMVSLFTILALLLDFTNAASYTPLLYMCAAFQVSHLLAGHASRMGYIPVITIIAIYLGLYFWRMAI